jgi:hypothetical protein
VPPNLWTIEPVTITMILISSWLLAGAAGSVSAKIWAQPDRIGIKQIVRIGFLIGHHLDSSNCELASKKTHVGEHLSASTITSSKADKGKSSIAHSSDAWRFNSHDWVRQPEVGKPRSGGRIQPRASIAPQDHLHHCHHPDLQLLAHRSTHHHVERLHSGFDQLPQQPGKGHCFHSASGVFAGSSMSAPLIFFHE